MTPGEIIAILELLRTINRLTDRPSEILDAAMLDAIRAVRGDET